MRERSKNQQVIKKISNSKQPNEKSDIQQWKRKKVFFTWEAPLRRQYGKN